MYLQADQLGYVVYQMIEVWKVQKVKSLTPLNVNVDSIFVEYR